jgi:hypothetical protein
MPRTIPRLWILALLVVTAACAAPRPLPPDAAIGASPVITLFGPTLEEWTKPGLDARQFSVDDHRCYLAATNTPRTPDLIVGGVVDVGRVVVENRDVSSTYYGCMAKLGYRRS